MFKQILISSLLASATVANDLETSSTSSADSLPYAEPSDYTNLETPTPTAYHTATFSMIILPEEGPFFPTEVTITEEIDVDKAHSEPWHAPTPTPSYPSRRGSPPSRIDPPEVNFDDDVDLREMFNPFKPDTSMAEPVTIVSFTGNGYSSGLDYSSTSIVAATTTSDEPVAAATTDSSPATMPVAHVGRIAIEIMAIIGLFVLM